MPAERCRDFSNIFAISETEFENNSETGFNIGLFTKKTEAEKNLVLLSFNLYRFPYFAHLTL
jgi:hypothetical protein